MNWIQLKKSQDQLAEIGAAAPMQFRIFGTMNSPTVFGVAIMAGLLMLPAFRKPLRIPAGILGFAAILLTGSRTAWIGFAAGLIFLFAHADKHRRIHLIMQLGLMTALVFFLLQTPVVGTFLSERFDRFSDIQSDESFGDRVQGYEEAFLRITHEPFGEGLGSAPALHTDEVIGPHDSSFLESLYSLGWLGTLLYASGLILAGIAIFRCAANTNADFVDAGRAIFIAFVVQSPLNSIMLGQAGFILWAVVALTLKELRMQHNPDTNYAWRPAVQFPRLQKTSPIAVMKLH